MKTRKVLSLLLALLFLLSSMSMLLITVSADPEPSTAPAITGFETVADPKSYKTASDSAKNPSKYFASMGFRSSNPITNAIDGNWNKSAVGNTASSYANAVYVDTDGTVKLDQPEISTIQAMDAGAPITYEKGQYLAFYKLSVSNAESLGSVTVWSDGSREGSGNINDAMDFYASADGEHWVLLSSYTGLCGDGSNPGANALANLTEEKTLRNSDDTEDWTSYGLKVSVKNATVVPNYIGIAVAKARNTANADVIFTEITVEEKASAPAITGFETVADPKSYKTASSSAKNPDKYFKSSGFRGSYPITAAIDGNWNASAIGNTANGYANAVYVDTDGTVKLDQPDIADIQAMETGAAITYEKGQYLAFYKLSVSNAESLGSVTVWSNGNREGDGNINDAMDFYASADGEHWVLLSSYTGLCGDGSNPGANALANLTEEKTLRNSDDTEDWTSYGLKVSVKNATVVPNYIGIAVAKARNTANADVIFTEITVEESTGDDPVVDPDAIFERTYDFETPVTPVANGLAVKSVSMAYTSNAFGAGVAQEAQRKIADGSLDDVLAWRSSKNLTELTPAISIVDGKMVKYDGTADTNDYLDYIKLELVEAGNVGTIKWYVGGKNTSVAEKFDVYVSADGETWTLAKAVTNGTSADYVRDNEGNWCTGIVINQNAVKFVMIAIVAGIKDEKIENLQYNVQEIQLMNTSYSFADDEAFKANTSEDTTTAADVTTTAPGGEEPTTAAKSKKKGCRSSVVGGGIAVIMLVAGAGTLAIRKKED